jgi:acetyl esterase/lipase
MTDDPYFDRMVAGQAALTSDPAALKHLESPVVPDPSYHAPEVEVTAHLVPGPHGDVPVRVYKGPSDAAQRPVFVWCHGGAWVGGDLDMHEADSTSREVCARTGGVLVSVGYSLALPGVYYPVPVDDVLAAWHWTAEQCRRWGAAPERMTLGGASAGGNIAAGALLRMRDDGAHLPSSVVLVYPSLHARLPVATEEQLAGIGVSAEFARLFGEALVLSMENYLGTPIDDAPAYVVPALADLAGLPPTLVVVCERDVLRLSGEHFAGALESAGVRTKLVLVPEAPHGHINQPWLPSAQYTYDEMADWIRTGPATVQPRCHRPPDRTRSTTSRITRAVSTGLSCGT